MGEPATCTECSDIRDHPYFSRHPFRWRFPRLTIYVPADKSMRVLWNRYPHNIIGFGFVVFGRCISVTWKG